MTHAEQSTAQLWGMVPLALLSRLSLRQFQVYTALASFQGRDACCYPSLEQIRIRLAGHAVVLKTRRISQIVQEIRAKGAVEVRRRGRGLTNIYILNPEATAAKRPRKAPERLTRGLGSESHSESKRKVGGDSWSETRIQSRGLRRGPESRSETRIHKKTTPKTTCENNGAQSEGEFVDVPLIFEHELQKQPAIKPQSGWMTEESRLRVVTALRKPCEEKKYVA